MMDCPDMKSVIQCFLEKILQILVYANGQSEEG